MDEARRRRSEAARSPEARRAIALRAAKRTPEQQSEAGGARCRGLVTAAPLATPAEVDVAIAEAEARLAACRHELEELEAEGRDAARLHDLVRIIERQVELLRERKRLPSPADREAGASLP